MQLDCRTWYSRWFFWSQGIVEAFKGKRYRADITKGKTIKNGTNLCSFFHTLMLAPLVIAFNVFCLLALIGSFTAWPIYLFGWSGYFWTIGAIVALIIISTVIVRYGWYPLYKKITERINSPLVKTKSVFREMVEEWWAGYKNKFCPIVTFFNTKEVEK